MGLFSKIFGTGGAPKTPASPPDREALVARFKRDGGAYVDRIIDGLDDDDAFELLWELLDASSDLARVDVIDHLAEFDLDTAQQERLLLAAVRKVPGAAWTGVSVSMACDLAEICDRAVDNDATGDALIEATGRILGALAQAALTSGPAGDILDLEEGVDYLKRWQASLQSVGALPVELLALDRCRELCIQGDQEGQSEGMGWDEALGATLQRSIDDLISREPRRGGSWKETLQHAAVEGDLNEATTAMTVAPWAKVDLQEALLERLQRDPLDETAQTLALLDVPGEALLELLVPPITTELQSRRLDPERYASPASQVGGLVPTGAPSVEDDEQMVPKVLEGKVMSALSAAALVPGQHGDLIFEALAAPSPNLRYGGAMTLRTWQPEEISEPTWALLESLREDSVPEVRQEVEALFESAEPREGTAS